MAMTTAATTLTIPKKKSGSVWFRLTNVRPLASGKLLYECNKFLNSSWQFEQVTVDLDAAECQLIIQAQRV